MLTEFRLCKHQHHLSKTWQSAIIIMSHRCMEKLCLFCKKVIKEKIFAIKQGPYGFSLMIMEAVYLEELANYPFRSKCHESCHVLFLPNSTLCKMQHDWLTASQHALRFQSLMNISTLPNALVNNRDELWLADSDIPPLREKCSDQAGLPGSLPSCAETLAGEDGSDPKHSTM